MPYTVVDKSSLYFNTVTYTGDGSASRSITGVGFQPDFTWVKGRNAVWFHTLTDVVRGGGYFIHSNIDTAEAGGGTSLITGFNSDGFNVNITPNGTVNNNGDTFVSWNWKANGAGVSNTAGSITSTVSANTTAGFSIVSYTGTGANATVGHGLGSAPKMIMIKNRTSAENWRVGHSSLTSWAFRLILDATTAQASEPNAFNSTAPTSTVFSVGTDDSTNKSTNSLIAYCFAEIKGYSKFGSYTGNGSSNGTFVYTGFMPKFIMIKRTDSADNPWAIYDTVRDTNNPNTFLLRANASNAEADDSGYSDHDHLSNGFKLRQTWSGINASGGTYIYMAFADSPFVSSKAIPTTAR
jgi:hypothetical protein